MVEGHVYVVVGGELLHPADVGNGSPGEEAVAVAGGEGLAVFAEELGPPLLSVLLDQRVVQVVSPRVGSLDEALLDLRSEEHTSELQSRQYLVCRLLLEKKN